MARNGRSLFRFCVHLTWGDMLGGLVRGKGGLRPPAATWRLWVKWMGSSFRPRPVLKPSFCHIRVWYWTIFQKVWKADLPNIPLKFCIPTIYSLVRCSLPKSASYKHFFMKFSEPFNYSFSCLQIYSTVFTTLNILYYHVISWMNYTVFIRNTWSSTFPASYLLALSHINIIIWCNHLTFIESCF